MALRKAEFDSKMFKTGRYDEDSKVLEITFNQGFTYVYFDVPLKTWEELVASESPGNYLNKEIKGKFSYKKIS